MLTFYLFISSSFYLIIINHAIYMSIHIHIYICVCVCVYTHIYVCVYSLNCSPVQCRYDISLSLTSLACILLKKEQSDQIRSVAQSCPTLCDPMNHSTPGIPVHHQLPEFTQTHVHRVSDAIQPSHPLSSPSPPAPNPSQPQSLFQ